MLRFRHAALRALLSTLALACIAALILLLQPTWLVHWREIRAGNEVISRVEAFRAVHKHLPETLQDVGVDDENVKVFYKKMSDDEYCVWFGTSLGESTTYYSRDRRWQ